MGKAIRALGLVLLLACSAQAGYIQNDRPVAPPPAPTNTTQETTVAPEEPTANGYIQNGVAGSLTELALDVLAALPALF